MRGSKACTHSRAGQNILGLGVHFNGREIRGGGTITISLRLGRFDFRPTTTAHAQYIHNSSLKYIAGTHRSSCILYVIFILLIIIIRWLFIYFLWFVISLCAFLRVAGYKRTLFDDGRGCRDPVIFAMSICIRMAIDFFYFIFRGRKFVDNYLLAVNIFHATYDIGTTRY